VGLPERDQVLDALEQLDITSRTCDAVGIALVRESFLNCNKFDE